MRILLVEDVEINQELVQTVLTRAGYVVEIASNGAEAVMAVQNGSYDVVLMDVRCPSWMGSPRPSASAIFLDGKAASQSSP